MKEPGPGKAHRLTGIAIGPFIMLRALGGILLSVDRLPVMRSERTFPAC